jgi:hypothetical protein
VIENWTSIEQNAVYGNSKSLIGNEKSLKALFEESDSIPQILYSKIESGAEIELPPLSAVNRFDFLYKIRKLLEFNHSWPILGFPILGTWNETSFTSLYSFKTFTTS